MTKYLAIALAAGALFAAPACAQSASADEAYIEKAWADGVLSPEEKANIARIGERSQRALAAKIATMKLAANGKVYAGEMPFLDPKANPWRPATAAAWNQGAPELAKANWNLATAVDLNRDRQPDRVGLYVNGKQTAVVATISGRSTIVYKTDGIAAGAEVFAAGNRIYLSIPDSSPIVIWLEGATPKVAYLGD